MSSKTKPKPTHKLQKQGAKDKTHPSAPKIQTVSPQPATNNATKKQKINPQPSEPLTEEQIRTEKQRKQALNRLSLLQQIYQLTQQKKSTLLLESVINNVQKDITSSALQIAPQPHEIAKYMQRKKIKQKINQTQGLSQSQVLQKEYKSLVQKKEIMIQELRQMEIDENKIRKLRAETSMSNSSSRLNKMPEMTGEAKQHWIKVRQMIKQHEKNSQRMHQLNMKKIEQDQILQQELEENKKKELSLEKRKIIENKLEEIKNRHDQRTRHVKESQIIVERLQKKTKLFQKLQDNWTKTQQQLQYQNQVQQFQNQHARRLINIRELKKYENEHDEKLLELEQKRKMKMTESKLSSLSYSFQKTRFSVDVLQQTRRNKEIEQEKLQQIKQLVSKKKQYSTILKQKFRSLSRLQNNISSSKGQNHKQENLKILHKQSRSMSALDIRNKGNQYMRTINSGVAVMKGRSHSKKQLRPLEPIKKQYKNYLPEVISSLKQSQGSNSASKKEIDMINTIMGKEKGSIEEKFLQAQIITQKLESGGKQKDILNSINAKIQILKRLCISN